MEPKDRKAALAAYRERKVQAGVFAIRCASDETCWVGRSPDLPAIRNRLFFTLRQGSYPQPSLQSAWIAQGADAFRFEVLEELDAEELGLGLDRTLKERQACWAARLGAVSI